MGVGASTVSTNKSNILNDLCVESITTTISNCTSMSTQNQLLQFSNVKGNININKTDLSQGATFDLSCVLSSSKTAEISNNLSSLINQFASSTGSGLPSLNGTTAGTESQLRNVIHNKLSTVSENRLTNILTQQQSFIVDNVTGNITLDNVSMGQQASTIAKALLTASDISSVVSSVTNTTTQSATSLTKNPIADVISSVGSAISGIFSGLFSSPGFTVIAIVVLCVGGLAAYWYYSKNIKMASSLTSIGASQFNNFNQVSNARQFM